MPIDVILFDADGVIQYAPENWSGAFARCLGGGDPALAQRFASEVYAAETACLSQVGGFEEALHGVLKAWNRIEHKPVVLKTMMTIYPHDEVLELIRSVRAAGMKCYIASNQQTSRAKVMSEQPGYSTTFDGELYSCNLGAAKPSQQYFERALKAVGARAHSTLFIDDRPENVEAARRAGLHAFVYDGRSGASVLKSHLSSFGVEC